MVDNIVKTRRCSGKQVIGIGKVYKCGTMLWAYEKKLCSSCVLRQFKLTNPQYDSEDREGLSPMYSESDVVMALRKAAKL